MKRFWLVLLSLGLALGFSASAFAVDVKFSGSFYAAGMYLDKTTFRSTYEDEPTEFEGSWNGSVGPSTAFYYQRLRVQSDFIVSPGLKLVTRFDAMERIWGGARGNAEATDVGSAETKFENQNIAFDLAYIDYVSPIGTFDVGYQIDGVWGTSFMDSSAPAGVLAWNHVVGPWKFIAKVIKLTDNSFSAVNSTATSTDLDKDKYAVAVKYSWKDGEAGVLAGYGRDATSRTLDTTGYKVISYNVQPYAKAQIGPVKIQAELNYFWGDYREYEAATTKGADVKLENLGVFLDAVADFGMFYGGATFAYISGDDPSTAEKDGGVVSGGTDWDPCLIMFNQERTYWVGTIPGYASSVANGSAMNNAWFYQGKIGVRPVANLDIMASLAYAKADKLPTDVVSKSYGWEVDVTGTYKITNNLSYMLGVGYLFTGDYYKGSQAEDVENNFLLINKLTLTF